MKKVGFVRKLAAVVFLFAFFAILPVAHADESNQAIKGTFNQPVQIPGHVLPAGTYWFVLPNNADDHFLVRVFNSDETMLIATVITVDALRSHPTGNPAFTFAGRGSEQPQAIVNWFYPGDTTGHEFLYPKQLEKELANEKHDTVVAGE